MILLKECDFPYHLAPQVRVALSSGTEIPIPSASYETVDYKSANDYAEDSEKDTQAKHVYKTISLSSRHKLHKISISLICPKISVLLHSYSSILSLCSPAPVLSYSIAPLFFSSISFSSSIFHCCSIVLLLYCIAPLLSCSFSLLLSFSVIILLPHTPIPFLL